MAEHLTTPVNPEASERVKRLGRKLDSMAILLESESHTSGFGDRETLKRKKRLADLRQRYEQLATHLELLDTKNHPLGKNFPPPHLCTKDELLLCEQACDAQLKLTQDLNDQIARVMRWVDEAASGRERSWLAKFRLAKIRRMLGDLADERVRFEPHFQRQNSNWQTLLEKLLLYRDQLGEQQDTQLAFEKIIRLTQRVGQLQKRVHQMQVRTHEMSLWLKNSRQNMDAEASPSFPLVDELRTLAQDLDTLGIDDLHRSRSRLALARKYFERLLDRGPNSIDKEDKGS